MTTRKTTKKPDWERLSKNLVGGFNPNINWRKIDFESTMGINLKLANSEPINWEDEYRKLKAFVPLALAQQRSELLDQVEKEMNKWWKDEGYWTCGANEAVEGVLEILSDKLSSLRLSIKKNK